jgi:microcystin-dependent protein
VLDDILVQAAAQYPATVALSPESVTVLMYASQFLELQRNWINTKEDPLDEITAEEWDTIQAMVANLYTEVFNPMIGYIFPVMTAAIPANCLLCDGSTYLREDYPQLYAALDSAFIVDADNFIVPDMRRKFPVGAGTVGADTYAVNEAGGENSVTLSVAEIPAHSHADVGHTHAYQPPGISGLALAPGELPVALPNIIPSLTGSSSANLANTGGDGAHENRPPFLALNFAVIAL